MWAALRTQAAPIGGRDSRRSHSGIRVSDDLELSGTAWPQAVRGGGRPGEQAGRPRACRVLRNRAAAADKGNRGRSALLARRRLGLTASGAPPRWSLPPFPQNAQPVDASAAGGPSRCGRRWRASRAASMPGTCPALGSFLVDRIPPDRSRRSGGRRPDRPAFCFVGAGPCRAGPREPDEPAASHLPASWPSLPLPRHRARQPDRRLRALRTCSAETSRQTGHRERADQEHVRLIRPSVRVTRLSPPPESVDSARTCPSRGRRG